MVLRCTETESVVWNLVQFRTNENGHFVMCFENQIGEVRAIHSSNPSWDRQVEALLKTVMEEKDVAAAFPQTDFETTGPPESDDG